MNGTSANPSERLRSSDKRTEQILRENTQKGQNVRCRDKATCVERIGIGDK